MIVWFQFNNNGFAKAVVLNAPLWNFALTNIHSWDCLVQAKKPKKHFSLWICSVWNNFGSWGPSRRTTVIQKPRWWGWCRGMLEFLAKMVPIWRSSIRGFADGVLEIMTLATEVLQELTEIQLFYRDLHKAPLFHFAWGGGGVVGGDPPKKTQTTLHSYWIRWSLLIFDSPDSLCSLFKTGHPSAAFL